ncbi:MAG: major capsid protein [Bacteroidales bacterium]|jgi:hypothetical protein
MSSVFTKVADLVTPQEFLKYFIQRLRERSALVQSGIILPDPSLDALVANGGKLINLPFFSDLEGDDQILDDSTDLNVRKIGSGNDQARRLDRAGVFGSTDLAAALSGADPMAAIADLFADWWLRREQRVLISTLDGVFASNVANNDGDLVLNASAQSGNAGRLSIENVMQAAQLLGDAKGIFTAVAMHSACETLLNMQYGGNTFTPASKDNVLPMFSGKSVIMDDLVPYNPETKEATIYLFGAGAVGYGEANVPLPFEFGREPLKDGGRSYLVQRRSFIMHVRGIKFREAVVEKQSPSNAELANGLNWLRVYEKKAIRVAKLVVRAEKLTPEAVFVTQNAET